MATPVVSGRNWEEMRGFQPIVEAALGGDRRAFSELVVRFQGMAISLAERRLGDRGLAEDASQEAFLTAFLKLSDLKNAGAFPTWFRRIVLSCCSRVQKQCRKLAAAHPDSYCRLADKRPNPFESMVRFQTRAMVAGVLSSLDGVSREACVQRYLFGSSYKRIAETLGVPEGTIKRRLHDARKRIIRTFKDQDRTGIRVGYLPISDHLMAMVSHYLHDRQRFKIHLTKYLSWGSLVASLRSDLLDAAFIMAPLALSLRNDGLPILYVLDAHHEGSAITVRKDSSIRHAPSLGRVGMPHAVSTHSMILADMIDSESNKPTDKVTAKYLSPSYLLNSLVSCHIDAFFCAEPWNTKAVVEGAGRIFARSRDLYPGHICCILVVREEFIAEKGEILRDYLRLLVAVHEYISEHPDPCARIQAQYTGVPAGIIEMILAGRDISFEDIVPDRRRIESVMRLALRTGIIDRPCDLDAFFRPDFV